MYDETLKDIYVDEKKIAYERECYIKAIESYTEHFGEGEVFVFSAPGRSEIGGNHTDHQCGEVLAASKNFWSAYKKGPFHICEVVCFFSIQFSQIVLLARSCMIYMLKVSFIES